METEDEFIGRLANPSTRRDAFGQLVTRYGDQLYWKIRRLVLSHEDANDVLQNTFIKAWTRIDTFQNKSKISTWLYRIAINEALDFIRKKKNVTTVGTDDSVAQKLMADKNFDGDRAQAILQEAIAKLPEVQRTVFNLHYFEDMKYSEISEILHTSEGALKASYHFATVKITEYVKAHEDEL
ncbi:MAG: RNA polymerase sigma factor [Prevotella sp.]|jgi:RNA polymerase sigma factor (sigma-70 family)